MVHGYHVIITTYGFWLPNDPRGSGSDFVGSEALLPFGPPTWTDSRRSVARKPHDVGLRLAAKKALKFPPVRFTGLQARAVARGFATIIVEDQITVWACCILPEHAHLVVARHRHSVERIVNLFKGAATRKLLAEGLHPLAAFRNADGEVPKCWARGERKMFLNTEADIRRSITYAEDNPLKEGKPRHQWGFVTPFEGLP